MRLARQFFAPLIVAILTLAGTAGVSPSSPTVFGDLSSYSAADYPPGRAVIGSWDDVESTSGAEPSQAWNCTAYASDPSKVRLQIRGEGSQFCSGVGWSPQKVRVQIQRQRWWGWQTVSSSESGYQYNDFITRAPAYNCFETGTYAYRIVTTGWVQGGARSVSAQSMNYLRTTC